jgi:hypothetical protein
VNASIAAWHHHPDRTDVPGREWFVLRRNIVLIAGEYRFGIGTLQPGEKLSCQFGLRCGLEHRGIENQWRGMKRLSVQNHGRLSVLTFPRSITQVNRLRQVDERQTQGRRLSFVCGTRIQLSRLQARHKLGFLENLLPIQLRAENFVGEIGLMIPGFGELHGENGIQSQRIGVRAGTPETKAEGLQDPPPWFGRGLNRCRSRARQNRRAGMTVTKNLKLTHYLILKRPSVMPS